jgi:hypothetical protein
MITHAVHEAESSPQENATNLFDEGLDRATSELDGALRRAGITMLSPILARIINAGMAGSYAEGIGVGEAVSELGDGQADDALAQRVQALRNGTEGDRAS